jgi:large conductance mechanosensitive channel
MGMLKEFKQFALKGNVIDLAIGVVIGAAFGKIISSFVDDLITPALLTPAMNAARLNDLNQLVIPGTAIKYGNFISTLISFTIIAFVLFLFIKAINVAKRKEEAAEAPKPVTPQSEILLMEIRDLLRGQAAKYP